MSSSLLMTRRFAPLFWCQFFSAFSDNFLKNSLVFLILFKVGGSDALISLAGAVFIAPFFSSRRSGASLPTATTRRPSRSGSSLPNRRCAPRRARFCAALGGAAVFCTVFVRGDCRAIWPDQVRHSPDHLARSEFPAGNALVEGATFMAILLGTIVGGIAARRGQQHPFHFS